MKLVSVTVENFRSITAARKIQISGLTTLVGPNNEGKSNILRAIVIAVRYLVGTRSLPVRTASGLIVRTSNWRSRDGTRYEWSSD